MVLLYVNEEQAGMGIAGAHCSTVPAGDIRSTNGWDASPIS
jgi:hypothetical protein